MNTARKKYRMTCSEISTSLAYQNLFNLRNVHPKFMKDSDVTKFKFLNFKPGKLCKEPVYRITILYIQTSRHNRLLLILVI